jgi:hypothetical protein
MRAGMRARMRAGMRAGIRAGYQVLLRCWFVTKVGGKKTTVATGPNNERVDQMRFLVIVNTCTQHSLEYAPLREAMDPLLTTEECILKISVVVQLFLRLSNFLLQGIYFVWGGKWALKHPFFPLAFVYTLPSTVEAPTQCLEFPPFSAQR